MLSTLENPKPIKTFKFIIYGCGTADDIKEHCHIPGFLHKYTLVRENVRVIGYSGSKVKHGLLGAATGWGYSGSAEEILREIQKLHKLFESNKKQAGLDYLIEVIHVAQGRAVCNANYLNLKLNLLKLPNVKIKLLGFDPIPGDVEIAINIDFLNLTWTKYTRDLSLCDSLVAAEIHYTSDPLMGRGFVKENFNTPLVPQYHPECQVNQDVVLGEQGSSFKMKQHLHSYGFDDFSFPNFWRAIEILETWGVNFHINDEQKCDSTPALRSTDKRQLLIEDYFRHGNLNGQQKRTIKNSILKEVYQCYQNQLEMTNARIAREGSIERHCFSKSGNIIIITQEGSYVNRHHVSVEKALTEKNETTRPLKYICDLQITSDVSPREGRDSEIRITNFFRERRNALATAETVDKFVRYNMPSFINGQLHTAEHQLRELRQIGFSEDSTEVFNARTAVEKWRLEMQELGKQVIEKPKKLNLTNLTVAVFEKLIWNIWQTFSIKELESVNLKGNARILSALVDIQLIIEKLNAGPKEFQPDTINSLLGKAFYCQAMLQEKKGVESKESFDKAIQLNDPNARAIQALQSINKEENIKESLNTLLETCKTGSSLIAVYLTDPNCLAKFCHPHYEPEFQQTDFYKTTQLMRSLIIQTTKIERAEKLSQIEKILPRLPCNPLTHWILAQYHRKLLNHHRVIKSLSKVIKSYYALVDAGGFPVPFYFTYANNRIIDAVYLDACQTLKNYLKHNDHLPYKYKNPLMLNVSFHLLELYQFKFKELENGAPSFKDWINLYVEIDYVFTRCMQIPKKYGNRIREFSPAMLKAVSNKIQIDALNLEYFITFVKEKNNFHLKLEILKKLFLLDKSTASSLYPLVIEEFLNAKLQEKMAMGNNLDSSYLAITEDFLNKYEKELFRDFPAEFLEKANALLKLRQQNIKDVRVVFMANYGEVILSIKQNLHLFNEDDLAKLLSIHSNLNEFLKFSEIQIILLEKNWRGSVSLKLNLSADLQTSNQQLREAQTVYTLLNDIYFVISTRPSSIQLLFNLDFKSHKLQTQQILMSLTTTMKERGLVVEPKQASRKFSDQSKLGASEASEIKGAEEVEEQEVDKALRNLLQRRHIPPVNRTRTGWVAEGQRWTKMAGSEMCDSFTEAKEGGQFFAASSSAEVSHVSQSLASDTPQRLGT